MLIVLLFWGESFRVSELFVRCAKKQSNPPALAMFVYQLVHVVSVGDDDGEESSLAGPLEESRPHGSPPWRPAIAAARSPPPGAHHERPSATDSAPGSPAAKSAAHVHSDDHYNAPSHINSTKAGKWARRQRVCRDTVQDNTSNGNTPNTTTPTTSSHTEAAKVASTATSYETADVLREGRGGVVNGCDSVLRQQFDPVSGLWTVQVREVFCWFTFCWSVSLVVVVWLQAVVQ